jgi:hypothetical protein
MDHGDIRKASDADARLDNCKRQVMLISRLKSSDEPAVASQIVPLQRRRSMGVDATPGMSHRVSRRRHECMERWKKDRGGTDGFNRTGDDLGARRALPGARLLAWFMRMTAIPFAIL